MTEVRNQRVTVLGLGRFGGGIAVARWLADQNAASITVVDADSAQNLADSIRQLEDLPIDFHLGPANHRDADFTQPDLIIASPAIPPTHPHLQLARNANVPITTEICLFSERCLSKKIVGITGTKGKSTTTALLGKMLAAQYQTWVGGNIGVSLLSDLPHIQPNHLVVLELSSYMLHYLGQRRWSPHVAVVTMLAADHLDWHGSPQAYLDAKQNLLRFQQTEDFAVLNRDDPNSAPFAADAPAQIRWFSRASTEPFALTLAGDHNQLNAQAAFTAAALFGVTHEQAQSAIKDFPGLPHRLQLVHQHNGVRYINDSIATIPAAAAAALQSFPPKKVIQIVGGSAKKHLPIDDLCAVLNARAKAVLCIGETGPKLAAALATHRSPTSPQVLIANDLPTAVQRARDLATPGDIILLSPGDPSYDQFPNFQHRGDRFTQLAREIHPPA